MKTVNQHLSLTTKLLVPIIGFFALVTGGLIAFYVLQSTSAESVQEAEDGVRLYQVFTDLLQSEETLALALSTETVNNQEVVAAFAAKDRDRLVELTLPVFKALSQQVGVKQFHFIEPPAITFVRLHQLDNFGDDLSSFRFAVVLANDQQQAVKGLELGRNGLGMRGIAPIVYNGLYLGLLDVGLDISGIMLDELKAKSNADWQIMLTRIASETAGYKPADANYLTANLLLYASTLSTPFTGSADVYERVLNGENVSSHTEGEKHLVTYSFPLKDYSGRIVGVLEAITDRTAAVEAQNRNVLISIVVLVVAFVVGGFIIVGFSRSILHPLTALTETAASVAGGDLSRTAEISRSHQNDELGILATAFNAMTKQLRGLIGSLEQRVADRTRALETNTEVSRRLSTILDQQQLLVAVVEELQKAYGYYHAHIYLFDEMRQNLVMAGGTGEAGKILLERGHKLQAGQGIVGRAAETGTVVLVSDTSLDPNWLTNPLLPDTKSEAAVPILIGDQVLGALDVQHNVVNGLGGQDADLLLTIANQVAVAIRNARQYSAAQRQAEQASQMDAIIHQIQSTQSIEDALRVAVRELGRTLEVPRTRVNLDVKQFSSGSKSREGLDQDHDLGQPENVGEKASG